jgi:hypothetical protein
VAEEVEKVNPDLVARDAKGEVYTVCYEAVNGMLLNEFLKEAPQSAGAGSDHCAAAKENGGCHGASPRAGFKNPEGERPAGIEQSRTANGRQ